jgi:hypothetical protein
MGTSRIWLVLLPVIAALALLPLVFAAISWFVAESPRQNPRIPSDWPAGVANHGEFYRWPLGTVQDSPILFGICVLLLATCLIFLIRTGIRASSQTP